MVHDHALHEADVGSGRRARSSSGIAGRDYSAGLSWGAWLDNLLAIDTGQQDSPTQAQSDGKVKAHAKDSG